MMGGQRSPIPKYIAYSAAFALCAAVISCRPTKDTADISGMILEARRLAESGDARAAEKKIKYILRKNGRNTDALFFLSRLQELKSDCSSRERTLNRITQIDGSYGPAFTELGKIYIKKGDYEKALEFLDRSYGIDPGAADVIFQYARVYRYRKDEKTARHYLEKGLNDVSGLDDDMRYNYLVLLAEVCADMKEYGRAETFLDEALRMYPERKWASEARKKLEEGAGR
ncbi:MAG: tetratricopeptide repeat protein [Elusimicrobia bacterium]|nr:tetratricopeptide repeat protein [Elusimicrobiota bacterium]